MIRKWRSFRFWTGHITFIGILFVIALMLTHSRSFQELERMGLSFAMQWMPETALRADIAVVAIDEPSLKAYGPWPWPRDRLGRAIRELEEHGVKAAGLALPLDQSQTPPALADLKLEIEDGESKLKSKIKEIDDRPKTKNKATLKARKTQRDKMVTGLKQLETTTYWLNRLDSDKKLATQLADSKNIILPAYFLRTLSYQPLPQSLQKFTVTEIEEVRPWYMSSWLAPITGIPAQHGYLRVKPPYSPLLENATSIGSLPESQRDRLEVGYPLLLRIDEQLFPSFSLLMAAYAEGLSIEDIKALPGQGVQLGQRLIPTSPDYVYYPYPMHLHEDKPPFPVYSIADLLGGKLGQKTLKDFTILVGHTTEITGLQSTILTDVPPVLLNAYNSASLMGNQAIEMPAYFYVLQRGLILLFALYLILLPQRLHGRPGGLTISAILALLMYTVGIVIILAGQFWLPFVLPALFLVTGHLLLAGRFHINVAINESRQEAALAHRELGSNYHGQGLFDQAFSEFKKCPRDHYILDPLYQLGQDFERKRLFTRALTVYEYLSEIDEEYRDVRERLQNLGGTSAPATPLATMIMSPGQKDTLLLDQEGIEKPMLGRYIIEAQLGKGAMGTVYLGRDSKIGRKVAIKTLPFNQEFEGHDLEEVKWRFYREAEASGRLDHNNIITIYDVGEEHDLAYIAMDYAQGISLDKYCTKDKKLPIIIVARIGQKIANALAYAHRKSVVHRDVKPANIIYDGESGSLKITDFGIASLIDDNKTRTGTLLGTPSYMSPEQVAGEKVDGRADIYALGVSLYQLFTGQLPFVGDTLANLMYQITNTRQKDITELRPELGACLNEVVNKAMEKDPELRFQTGDELAQALRRCELELNKKASANKAKQA